MNLLIRSAQLVEQSEDGKALKLSSSSQDLLIQDGIISRIADSIEAPKGAEIVENVSVVSPGWLDTFARFCDPGDEYREDLRTGAAAAAAGGFTGKHDDPILIHSCVHAENQQKTKGYSSNNK